MSKSKEKETVKEVSLVPKTTMQRIAEERPELVDELTYDQKLFLKVFEVKGGNIMRTCAAVNFTPKMNRSRYAQWRKSSPAFREASDDIREGLIDYVEEALFKQIEEGNIASIIFFLKCQAKHRGYIEKAQVEYSGSIETKQSPEVDALMKRVELKLLGGDQ